MLTVCIVNLFVVKKINPESVEKELSEIRKNTGFEFFKKNGKPGSNVFSGCGIRNSSFKKRNSQSYLSCTVKRKRVKPEAEVLQGLLEMTGNSRQWNIYS